jgi:hypothetical protein
MRFMLLLRATDESEGGAIASLAAAEAVGRYSAELVRAGVLLAGDQLFPTSMGARIRFSARGQTILDGPFRETREVIAGYWMIQVKSWEEAIEWARRAPFGDGEEIELRRVFEADLPADVVPPDLLASEQLWLDKRSSSARNKITTAKERKRCAS